MLRAFDPPPVVIDDFADLGIRKMREQHQAEHADAEGPAVHDIEGELARRMGTVDAVEA